MPQAVADRSLAVIVGVQLPGVSDIEHASNLAELGRLARTLGFQVASVISQRRESLAAAAVLGEGKLRELAELTGGKGVVPSGVRPRRIKGRSRFRGQGEVDAHDGTSAVAGDETDSGREVSVGDAGERSVADAYPTDAIGGDWGEDTQSGDEAGAERDGAEAAKPELVVVDHELSPSQARNLERATGARVLDRTGVIVEIFHRHARSREARIQVEIARLSYVAPRMRESASSERQRGRGAGESMLELDRRKVRDRIAELRQELEAIQKQQANRRHARREQPRVALVGYTNAGKSCLMRALTGCDVLVEDKLFATLDTTVRALFPEQKPRILVSDTVGFIKKLPHDLVASFRSTLDEALEASLLLHVVDASDPSHVAQMEVTRDVLSEIGADLATSKIVFNKADQLGPLEREQLQQAYPDALVISALHAADVAKLTQVIVEFFEAQMVCGEISVPYHRHALVGEAHDAASVLSERYDDMGTHLQVKAWPAVLARLRNALARG